jgi:hypothetical protein
MESMRRMLLAALCAILMNLSPLFGQGMTLTGSGYASPTLIRVSPGQVTTLFVSGLNTVLTKPQRATSLPLPNSLAGISVTINQSSLKQSVAVPLLAVEQLNTCSIAVVAPPPVPPSPTSTPSTVPPECLLTAITLQIPYELTPLPTVAGDSAKASTTEIVVTANGVASRAFAVLTITDTLHVLNTCDTFPPKGDGSPITVNGGCSSVVTHADGTLVTADAPGKAGEVLVIYTFGLGQTTPAVKTGSATPTPAPVLGPASRLGSVRTLELQYDFRPNAEPSRPFNVLTGVISTTPPTAPVILLAPVFVGLTPEQVGLYQINVQLPSAFPAAVLPCTTLSVCTGNLAFCPLPIQSNLTIDIGGVTSFDGAAICIQPGQ